MSRTGGYFDLGVFFDLKDDLTQNFRAPAARNLHDFGPSKSFSKSFLDVSGLARRRREKNDFLPSKSSIL